MANMVFHLIPPRALDRAADGLAERPRARRRACSGARPTSARRGRTRCSLHDPNRAAARALAGASCRRATERRPRASPRRSATRATQLDEEALRARPGAGRPPHPAAAAGGGRGRRARRAASRARSSSRPTRCWARRSSAACWCPPTRPSTCRRSRTARCAKQVIRELMLTEVAADLRRRAGGDRPRPQPALDAGHAPPSGLSRELSLPPLGLLGRLARRSTSRAKSWMPSSTLP